MEQWHLLAGYGIAAQLYSLFINRKEGEGGLGGEEGEKIAVKMLNK